ncbi:tRNA threonylcarbamoyladenosine biosynthesis protein TsaE [hydrothermal vent metagenome]|uniref:tRNA threonylcarbamoyladenosine biosynthesis protein TsaE n=1 Tax=hydrothermal vent metagenome TaxID=652676 RepID=A0A3B1APQ5_9ZZZZ
MTERTSTRLSELNFDLADEPQSIKLARCFAEQRPQQPSLVVYLKGDLGAGKTTFCRGFIQASGHDGKVKSPTYTLIEPYDLDGINIIHMDLYRLSDAEELEHLGVDELIQHADVCLIEWPERGADRLPAATIAISIKHCSIGRQLHVESHREIGISWLQAVQSHFSA